jgi:hypothetical protein
LIPSNGYRDESQTIPPKVTNIAWNDSYVITEQQGLKRGYPNGSFQPNKTLTREEMMIMTVKVQLGTI